MTDPSGAAGGLLSGAGSLAGGTLDAAGAVAGPVLEHVAAAGDTLAGLAERAGVPLPAAVEANPHLIGLDLLPVGARVTLPLAAAAPVSSGQPASSPAAPPGAPGLAGGLTPAEGGAAADWRVMAQATPPSGGGPTGAATRAATGAATGAAPATATLPPDLVAVAAARLSDAPPGLARIAAEALVAPGLTLPPELQAPTPLTLAAALARAGWLSVAAPQARPGDVVILATAEGLRAVRVPEGGLAAALATAADDEAPALAPRSSLESPAVMRNAQPQPPGFDAAAPSDRRERGRGRGRDRNAGRAGGAVDPRRAWIDRVLPIAKWIKAKWGVPVAVTVAHGALVSDWGRIAPENDFFGLLQLRRAGAAATPVRNAAPGRETAYATLDEAADDYGAYLRGDRRFAAAFGRRDVAGFVRDLAAGGWGGDGRYGERLACLIALNGLDAFDAA